MDSTDAPEGGRVMGEPQRLRLHKIERIKANIAANEGHYAQREDWGDEGPDSTYGAVAILLREVVYLSGALTALEAEKAYQERRADSLRDERDKCTEAVRLNRPDRKGYEE
jgi:hypothetical protein